MILWRYVITHDTGTAPNFEQPGATLALCKPRIRIAACPGDVVLAFCGSTLSRDPETVRWAGVVDEVIPFEGYWNDGRFQGKKPGIARVPDNIYEPDPGQETGFRQHEGSHHGRKDMPHDLDGKNVLMFRSKLWDFAEPYPHLPDGFHLSMGKARRGHRRSAIDGETWDKLREWLSNSSGPVKPRAPAPRRTAGRC